MAMTFEERNAQIKEMLHDADLNLTPRESFELILRWMRFEYAVNRLARQERRVEKYAKWLADTTEVFNMRKTLTKL